MGHLVGGHLSTLLGRLGVMVAAAKSLLGHPEPVAYPFMLKPALKKLFPEATHLNIQRLGEGEHADYAFVEVHQGSTSRQVFVKYRIADDFDARRYRRFLNEATYLKEFAPLVSIPHAALLDLQNNAQTCKAHLVLESLQDRCKLWTDLPEPERFQRVGQVVRLLAEFHAQWMLHPALKEHPSGPWGDQWPVLLNKHRGTLEKAIQQKELPSELLHVAEQLQAKGTLEQLYTDAGRITLCHGDFHFGQVLVDRLNPERLYLIDYEHTSISPFGFDLAHFLVIRFNWFERQHLEQDLLEQYLQVMHQHGIGLTQTELWQGYRVGILNNFLLMWARFQRDPDPMFLELLQRLFVALQEHQVLQPSSLLK